MVEEFLDLAYQKRFHILRTILNSENQQIHQKKLLEKLDISLTTLVHTLELIQEDLFTFGCQSHLSIQFDSLEKKYSLTKKLDFNIDLLLLYYLEDSLKFRLLRAMMTDSLPSVKSISSNWFVTPSSLRREIHSLQKLLLPWQLEIKTTHTKISLIGKESTIRLFYAFLFLHTYGAYQWIFRTISYHEITELLEFVPDDILEKKALDKQLLIHYYCAVSIVRMNKQFYLEEDFFTFPLYKPYAEKLAKQTQMFSSQLQQWVPSLSKKEKQQTVLALFSNILAWADFKEDNFPTRFFLLDSHLLKKHFLKMIFEVHDCFHFVFTKNTTIPLHKLCNIHYQMMLYHPLLLENIYKWEKYSTTFSTIEKEKFDLVFQQLDRFIFKNPNYQWLIPYKSVISYQYAQLISQYAQAINSNHIVTIGLYAKFSTSPLKKLVQSMVSPDIKISITETLHKQIDIIVSDVILSKDVLENLSSTCKIVYVHLPLNKTAYYELKTMLNQINYEKKLGN